MAFRRTGDRNVYGSKFRLRREAMVCFALAEYVEKQGRFTDKLINCIWSTLEETTWVASAHNKSKPDVDCCLPYAFAEEIDYIDLYSASTASSLAWIWYLCKETLDNVTTLICDRIEYEVDKRVIKPFLSDEYALTANTWSGVKGNKVNNWNPWIVSNVLTVCAFMVKDMTLREIIVRRSMKYLDNFTSIYHDDGGCDEGPSYWGAAAGALFDCCNVLYDMTNGYVDIFNDELLKRMGEYEAKVAINGERFLNFADSPSKLNPNGAFLYDFGNRCNSEMLRSFGLFRLDGGLSSSIPAYHHMYRSIRLMVDGRRDKANYVAPLKFWLDGIIVAGTREFKETDKGLYLAFKGGTNNESHNHNDVGNVVVFADGKPIFLDAGVGTYTRRTFSKERYTIWSMRSDYHNCATINGTDEASGAQYRSCDEVYDQNTGKLTMSLKNAYPSQAGISEYTRSAVLQNSKIVINDVIKLETEGSVTFNYICEEEPYEIKETSFLLHGRKITFDDTLRFEYEPIDSSSIETRGIPKGWGANVLYRIKLTNKKPIKDVSYELIVQ